MLHRYDVARSERGSSSDEVEVVSAACNSDLACASVPSEFGSRCVGEVLENLLVSVGSNHCKENILEFWTRERNQERFYSRIIQ